MFLMGVKIFFIMKENIREDTDDSVGGVCRDDDDDDDDK